MYWITPQVMDLKPGTPGTVIVLIDKTRSMPDAAACCIRVELWELRKKVPNIKAFGFVYGIAEIPVCRECHPCEPPTPPDLPYGENGTYLGRALALVAQMRPQKTIIFSDGGARDKAFAIQVADQMTGSIDAFWCNPERSFYDELLLEMAGAWQGRTATQVYRRITKDCDVGFMKELARRGRGRFVDYSNLNLKPDLERSTMDARQRIHVDRRTVVHHHYHAPQHVRKVSSNA